MWIYKGNQDAGGVITRLKTRLLARDDMVEVPKGPRVQQHTNTHTAIFILNSMRLSTGKQARVRTSKFKNTRNSLKHIHTTQHAPHYA